MLEQNQALEVKIDGMIKQGAFAEEPITPELEAVIAIASMSERIWEIGLRLCMGRVQEHLQARLPGWKQFHEYYTASEGCRPVFHVELYLSKEAWIVEHRPRIFVYFGTECSKGPTYFELAIKKSEEAAVPSDFRFDTHNSLKVQGERSPLPLHINGINDLRSAEGIRYLLARQAVMEIVEAITGFVSRREQLMNDLFHSL